jgi:dihydroorotase
MARRTLTIRRPDDWHVHLRDGALLSAVVGHTARTFGRAIVMPNLVPPVTTAEMARLYRARILRALPTGSGFKPLMTCYLTDATAPDDLEAGQREGVFTAAKLYPAHATTNSAHGVTDVRYIRGVLARMEKTGLPLLVHGEVTDGSVDVFDREAVFIDRILAPLLADFPALKVVFEHVTTREAVDFVLAHAPRLAATVTPHHLMINRNAMFAGGIRPHMYCLPVAKREVHRLALRRAATSGSTAFFLGTDSAPHPVAAKETSCGCAGIYNAPVALACYAQVFAEEGALDRLEAFASLNGPGFYGLPPNGDTVTLEEEPERAPDRVAVAGPEAKIRPFLAGEMIAWRLARS